MAKKPYAAALTSKTIIKDQSLLRHGDIKTRIRRVPELEALIPPPQPDELRQLEANLLKEGCRDALLVWETTEAALTPGGSDETVYALVDGYNRHRICTQHGLDFKIHLHPFDSLTQVRQFMIDNQLGRRNLTPEQASYLRGLRYHAEKGEKGRYDRQAHKGQNELYAPSGEGQGTNGHKAQNDPYGAGPDGATSEKLARRYNVSSATIKRDAEFAAGLERLAPELRRDVLSGVRPVNKTDIQRLGKKAGAPLASWPEVEETLRSAELKPTPAPAPPSADELCNRLETMVHQLKQKRREGGHRELCLEIAQCARRLAELPA